MVHLDTKIMVSLWRSLKYVGIRLWRSYSDLVLSLNKVRTDH